MRFTIIAILIAGSVGVVWFYILPEWEESQSLVQTRNEYDETLAQLETFTQLRDQYIQELEDFPPEQRDRIEEMLPQKMDRLDVYLRLDTLAREHDIIISDLSIEFPDEERTRRAIAQNRGEEYVSDAEYQTYLVEMSFASSYSDFFEYLKKIESHLRLFDVVELSVSSDGDNTSELLLDAESLDEDEERTTYTYTIVMQTYALN